MMKKYSLAFALIVLATFLFNEQAASKEDTAQITFDKTAISKQNLSTYTVRKGDVLSSIIRMLPGITEKDIPDVYRTIKELNPEIDDLNKLTVGQMLVLPGNIKSGREESIVQKATAESPVASEQTESLDGQRYTIKKGDSLIKIVHRELNIKSNTQKTLLIIKSLNPNMVDVNKIYTGQIIKLPESNVLVKAPKAAKKPEPEAAKPTEIKAEPETIVEVKEKIIISPEARLAVIKHVVTQMNGSIITTGKYYLPISKTEQVTIDCAIIPVIEFDGKTTLFLDLENRANTNLKKMISDKWSNYHLVKVNEKDDIIAILKKIFSSTNTHEMAKKEKPTLFGSYPPIEVTLDWLITRKDPKAQPLAQGLRLVYENDPLLPKAIISYARKNGLIITEMSPETGLVGKPEEIYSLASIPIFPKSSAKEFSYALLSYFGLKAEKDVDIKIFNISKDGFNLSIKADVVVKHADKQYIIFARNLPLQFVNILKKAGNELLFVSDNDQSVNIMENILRTFNFTFASGYFTFSGSDKNYAPFTLSFGGTKIKTNQDIYVIDFDIDPGVRGLLREGWLVNIAKY